MAGEKLTLQPRPQIIVYFRPEANITKMSWLEDIGDQQLVEYWRKCSDWGTARVKKKKDDMLQQNQLCGYTIHQFVAENNKKKITDKSF